jgi:hypothetical protein
MGCSNVISVAASMFLSATLIAVGIAFFSPYWLSNVSAANGNELIFTDNKLLNIIASEPEYVTNLPDRGLWAQCGVECLWFWENGYSLQTVILTPLSKSLGLLCFGK